MTLAALFKTLISGKDFGFVVVVAAVVAADVVVVAAVVLVSRMQNILNRLSLERKKYRCT